MRPGLVRVVRRGGNTRGRGIGKGQRMAPVRHQDRRDESLWHLAVLDARVVPEPPPARATRQDKRPRLEPVRRLRGRQHVRRGPRCYPPMPEQLAILKREGARIGTESRAFVLAEPAEHDSAATGPDAAQPSGSGNARGRRGREAARLRAFSPTRQPLPVAAALVLECFCRCILHTMFSTFTEAACLIVAAYAAVSLGTVPWARMRQPPHAGPARRHATSASAAAIHQRDGP